MISPLINIYYYLQVKKNLLNKKIIWPQLVSGIVKKDIQEK